MHRHREHVALAADRLDDRRLARVVAQAMAQTAHLHVDASVQRLCLAALRQLGIVKEMPDGELKVVEGFGAPDASEASKPAGGGDA